MMDNERSGEQRRMVDGERSGDPRRMVDGERSGDQRRMMDGPSNRDRDRDRNHSMNDDRGADKYDRSSQSRPGNGDYFNRNAPPAAQLAPRFLKQKQQQQSGRMEEEPQQQTQQRSGPPQSWSRDRGGEGYDSRGSGGRDWHDRDRDRESFKRPSEVWPRGGGGSDGEKRPHRNDQPPGSTSGGRDRIEKESITIKRKEPERKSESHEPETLERPNSRNSRSSQDKESNAKAPSLPAPKEIVSWADEPGDEDLSSPSTAPTTTDRGFSEERRTTEGGSSGSNKITHIERNAQHTGHHHPSPPAPITREKNFEADSHRSENKQQPTLVPLRRIPGQQQQSPVASNASTATSYPDESNKKPQQQQRTPPAEAVQNVWASRTKTNRDQPPESTVTESGDKHTDDSDISRKGPHSYKDPRGRPTGGASSAPSSKNASGPPASSTSSATVRHGGSGGGGLQRRRGSNSRYSGSYDEYEDDYRTEPSKGSSTGTEVAPTRKSKSPELDDRSKKDAPSRGGTNNSRQQQQSGSGSSAGGSFRMRRGGAGRGGYDDEEPSAPQPPRHNNKDGPTQQQQRPPRFQQDEPAHKVSKEEHWSDEHHNDSSGGRSNNPRRGGTARGPASTTSARGRNNKGDDYEAPSKEPAHIDDGKDHHQERKSDSRGSKVEEHNNKRPDRRNEPAKETRNDRNDKNRSERVDRGGGGRANDQDRGGYRTGGGQSGKGGGSDQQRYEQRPKTNLPPRLAKLETANRLKGHKSDSGETGHSSSSAEVSSSAATPPAKENTPPVNQQLQSPAWDKNSAPAAAPSPSLTNAMASLALVEQQQSTEKPQPLISAGEEVVLDGTTPPSTTIIFENTNLKSSAGDLKGRGTPPGVPQQGPKAHVQQQQQQQKAQPLPNGKCSIIYSTFSYTYFNENVIF